jgi:N-methylhydantoinase B
MVFGPTKAPMQAFYFADFAINPPEGVLGGGPGALAALRKVEADGSQSELAPIGDVELQPGEWVLGRESGGGGYGNPLERDPEAARSDVMEGWVSREAAERDYGVIFDGEVDDESLAVNAEQTRKRREQLEGDQS